ncbi:CHRD domain-containing protein [bacterium]|nr:MAG: CHRD domain-containing protein [bacterium]
MLNGPSEAPPNASPGAGTALVVVDVDTNQMTVDSTFFGLTGTTTASHIHCCTATPGTGTAGVTTTTPTFAGFPLGVTAGNFTSTLDLGAASTYNPAFVTSSGSIANARSALLAGLNAGTSYFNIHTTTFGGGEIRGFLRPLAAVPEPGTLALLGAGLLGIALVARRQPRDAAVRLAA